MNHKKTTLLVSTQAGIPSNEVKFIVGAHEVCKAAKDNVDFDIILH